MNKTALVSGANDDYADLLAEMLCSLNNCNVPFDIKIFDLGLGEKSRQKIVEAAANRSLEILDPGWTILLQNSNNTPVIKKVYLAKPFIPEFFPGYEGYIWADADLWFQDAAAISHYIQAAKQHGSAFCYESHPLYQPTTKIKHFQIFNIIFIRSAKIYLFNQAKKMFGKDVALAIGVKPVLNSGIFYMSAKSPIWGAWQDAIKKANLRRHHKSNQICDQTCLQVAIFKNGMKHGVLPAIFNWIPNYCAPILDKNSRFLVDPMYPNEVIYTFHLVGNKNRRYLVFTSDGNCEIMTLRWSEYKNNALDHI